MSRAEQSSRREAPDENAERPEVKLSQQTSSNIIELPVLPAANWWNQGELVTWADHDIFFRQIGLNINYDSYL